MARRGILFVISGPSGAGKTTLVRQLLTGDRKLEFSVSYTTRPRRAGEVDGKDYHFVDERVFERMTADGAFLEWACVHGRCYGTATAATDEALARGKDLLLDIDVQGARQIREHGSLAGDAVFVFVMPPSFEALRNRLSARGSEGNKEVARRLAAWARETREAIDRSDYLIVNEHLNRAVDDLVSIVRAERCRTERLADRARAILAGQAESGPNEPEENEQEERASDVQTSRGT